MPNSHEKLLTEPLRGSGFLSYDGPGPRGRNIVYVEGKILSTNVESSGMMVDREEHDNLLPTGGYVAETIPNNGKEKLFGLKLFSGYIEQDVNTFPIMYYADKDLEKSVNNLAPTMVALPDGRITFFNRGNFLFKVENDDGTRVSGNDEFFCLENQESIYLDKRPLTVRKIDDNKMRITYPIYKTQYPYVDSNGDLVGVGVYGRVDFNRLDIQNFKKEFDEMYENGGINEGQLRYSYVNPHIYFKLTTGS